MDGLKKLLTKSDRIWPKFLFLCILLFVITTCLNQGLVETGLNFPPNLNTAIESIWFAELSSFILLIPFLLFWPGKKNWQRIAVYLALGVVALMIVTFFIGAESNYCYPYYSGGGLKCGYFDAYTTIRRSLYYHTFDSHDYLLESIAPRFIRFQMPFVLAGVITHAGITSYKKLNRRN